MLQSPSHKIFIEIAFTLCCIDFIFDFPSIFKEVADPLATNGGHKKYTKVSLAGAFHKWPEYGQRITEVKPYHKL